MFRNVDILLLIYCACLSYTPVLWSIHTPLQSFGLHSSGVQAHFCGLRSSAVVHRHTSLVLWSKFLWFILRLLWCTLLWCIRLLFWPRLPTKREQNSNYV